MTIEPGLEASFSYLVTADDTADALGSGDVDVLGTPKVVALCEQAAVRAVAPLLLPGQTTVGSGVHLAHAAPTLVGRRVTAKARVEQVEGRTITFAVEATDDAGPIAYGTHTRVLVDRDTFARSAAER